MDGSSDRNRDGSFAIADNARISEDSQGRGPDVPMPGRDGIVVLPAAPELAMLVDAYVALHGARVIIADGGKLGLRLPDGGLVVIEASEAAVRPFLTSPERLTQALDAEPSRLADLMIEFAAGRTGLDVVLDLVNPLSDISDDLAQSLALGADTSSPAGQLSSEAGRPLGSGGSSQGVLEGGRDALGHPLRDAPGSLHGLSAESNRWGRDDIKRGEAGSRGHDTTTDLGRGLPHLVGLSDEEVGHRNGEKLTTFDNDVFPTIETPTGTSLDHLWLLGDTEYTRASGDDDPFAGGDDGQRIIHAPLIDGDVVFRSIEDTLLSDRLFPMGASGLPISGIRLAMDPTAGRITLASDGSLIYTPAYGFSGKATFSYSFIDPRTGETVSGKATITVEAVADPASISGAAATLEDTSVATPITVTLNDPDGSEEIEKVVVTGLPSGASLTWDTSLPGNVFASGGTFVFTGKTTEIQALLASLRVSPPADFDGQIVLGVTATTIERNVDPRLPGYLDRETVSFSYVIDVEAVADLVTATGDDETTDEDISVHLDDLATTFGDLIDGSETHVVEIRGVDPGAKLLDGASGSEYPFTLDSDGNKTYTLAPADVGSVWFLPPPDQSGTFDGMTIVAIATEAANSDRETASAPIRVVVVPVADPVDITAPAQATNEDTAITFGDDIDIVVADPSTQELIEVVVAGFPAGTRIQYTDEGGGAVDYVVPAGGGSVTLGGLGSGFSEAQIRAALATLTLTPPDDSDRDIALTVSATTEDTGSGGAADYDTQTIPMVVTVAAVADTPTVDFSAGPNVVTDPGTGGLVVQGTEDENLPLPISLDLADLDGSETMDPVVITGLPAGYSFLGLTAEPDGSYVIGGTKAAIQTALGSLVIVPPANADDDFTLTVTVTARESNPTTAGADDGDVAQLTATTVTNIPVVFIAAHDAPVITGASTVVEDTTVGFGANIAIARDDDSDGSESITEIVISGVPSGATIHYPGDGTLAPVAGVVVTVGTDGSGNPTYTLTRSTGDEQDLRDALALFALTPPADSDRDIALAIAVTTMDNDGVTGTSTATHTIAVRAAADAPTFSAGPQSGLEDQPIALSFSVGRSDIDPTQATGSEAIERVVIGNIPAGFTLTSSSTAATLTLNGDGTYTVTGPDLSDPVANEAAINAVLGALTLTPGATRLHFDDDFTLSVAVTSIETNLTGGQVETLRNTQTFNLPVTVLPVADAVTKTGASTVVEDNAVAFGADIALTRVDGNATGAGGGSSETITAITVSGIPAGSTVSTGTATPNVTAAYDAGAGTITLTLQPGGVEADIQAALDKLTLTPPADSDIDITLNLAVTTVDRWGTAEASAPVTTSGLTHAITVKADAVGDAPIVTASGSGNEDQPIHLVVNAALDDTDTSEYLSRVEITGLPAGATLTWTSLPSGVATPVAITGGYRFAPVDDTPASTAALRTFLATNLRVTSPLHQDDDITLTIVATNTERATGATQLENMSSTSTTNVTLTVLPVADAVTKTGASTVVEDNAVAFGADILLTRVDGNATGAGGGSSETITAITVSGIPAGSTISTGTVTPNVTATYDAGAGTITLTLQPGGVEADIQAALDKLTLTPPADSDIDITLGLAVTTVDRWGTAEASAPVTTTGLAHTITVTADAAGDEPTVSGAATGVEDQTFALPVTVTLGDTDGSEILDKVEITGLPTGATLAWTGLPTGVTATAITGGWRFDQTSTTYATTTALQTFLANNLTIRPPQDSAADFDLTVTAFNYEQNLSGSGGRTATLPSTSASITVTVTPAFDTTTLPTTSSLVSEDEDRAPSTSDGSAPNITNIPGSVVFGATINSAITRSGDTATFDAADRSEGITQIVLSGLPAGTVTWTDRPGVTVTEAPAGTFTIAVDAGNPPADPRALETEIRLVLASFTYAASDHGSADIPIGISISRQDVDPDTGTAITGVALTATHTIVVNAVADAPTVTGDTEFTREDVRVQLDDLSAALRDTDGSETLTVQITGVPTGGSLTNAAGTAYTSPSAGTYTIPVASLGDVYFVPPPNVSGVFAMTIIATATEATVAGEATADDVASVRAPISVTVLPAVDAVIAEDSGSTVNENGMFNLGANIIESATDADATPEFSLADVDGSQSLTITITGFPAGITAFMDAGYTLPAGVTATFNAGTGTFTLSGSHGGNVMTALAQVRSTVTEDGDANFTLTVTAETAENNPDGLPEGSPGDLDPVTTVITHSVTVRAAADTPTVDRGSGTKAAVLEDSGFVAYPVTVALNDTDGSETYSHVRVTYSTTGSGARPVVEFTAGGTTVDTTTNGTYTLGGATLVVTDGQATFTGATADIEAALASMRIRPGANNAENIAVTIQAIAVESNPTEDNNGATAGMGGGVTGPEIALATATRAQSFTIPVTPVPDTTTLNLPTAPTGTEDTTFLLGTFSVTGSGDTDGSEARFIEIQTSSYPVGTSFTSVGSAVGTVVTAGWLRIPESAFGTLSIEPPTHYSGTISLVIRGVVTDTHSSTGTVTTTSADQTLAVTVRPDADGILQPGNSVGVEDRGAIGFGAILASATTGIRAVDNGTDVSASEDNNADTETLSQVRLVVPADTATQTYVIGGSYAPGSSGTFAGAGSALVTYDAASRTYTITSSLITGDGSAVSLADRQQAETDIRATLAAFTVTMGPDHTDRNGSIAVTATTLDVNGGVANSQDNSFTHHVVVQAVADAPTISATDPSTSTPEDSANVPLIVTVGQSADDDGSETLTVRITVPSDANGVIGTLTGSLAGITLTHQGGGVYLITATGADNAARAALLNAFMDGGAGDLAFDPRDNWSGTLTGTNGIKVEAISTEAATAYGDTSPASDDELAQNNHAPSGTTGDTDTKVEIVTDYIDVVIAPQVDAPTVKGNAVGVEDTLIPVPMSVTLADRDGSETYQVLFTGVVPAATRIFGAGGVEILPTYDATLAQNVYVLGPDDVQALAILPPLHYSSALSGNIELSGVARVTDGATVQDVAFTPIPVRVTGVADVPGDRTLTISAEEDEPIAIGASILAIVGGDLDNLLVDADGSETLSFVLSGMPAGVIPMTASASGLTYIGHGTWSVTAEAMETLTLPALPNFSGENPYGSVRLRAVAQEIDGSQATSPEWDLTIDVNPVINAATVDGFSSWGLGATLSEGALESGADISLASTASHAYVDNDGSEIVLSYTFDLSNLIADAGIGAWLEALEGSGADLDDLVAGYISGTFTYDSAAGTITVSAGNIGGVALDGALFKDSNQDFSIGVSALVRDTASFASTGSTVTVDKVETGSFAVNLIGTADTPTAYATAPVDPGTGLPTFAGDSGTQIPLSLGGDSTDTDIALGRPLSEDIYYVISLLNPGDAPLMTFTDGAGTVIGLDNGDYTWVLTPAELAVLHIVTHAGDEGLANLRLTTIATENDGDVALNHAEFDVLVGADPGGGGPGDPGDPPLEPILTIGTSSGLEDGTIVLDINAQPGIGDTTNPSIAVMFSNIPAGAEVIGARYNYDTGRWVASAAAVNAGLVSIRPPENFSGTMAISVEAVATNASLQQTTTGLTSAPIAVEAVADGVDIGMAAASGTEDALITLDFNIAVSDTRGTWVGENAGETVGGIPVTLSGGAVLTGPFAYVTLSDGATLPGHTVVVAGDSDASIDGQNLVGSYRVPAADLDAVGMLPANDWHGTVSVTVAAYSREGSNGDIALSSRTFSVGVSAVADAPSVTVADASGTEDTAILLAGLTASLNDTVTTNGAEVLSVTISGVPEGSLFSAGSNNGDGSWTIPLPALATLRLTPPEHFSGTMTLTLTAIALELANGDEAQTSADFTVTVAPRADTVEILAENVVVAATGEGMLDLNVRMADVRGSLPGEDAPELIRITFTSVPTGVSLFATAGGTMANPSSGTYEFTGTEAEANAIGVAVGAGAVSGNHTVNLSAVTIDGGDTLATPVVDSFRLTLPTITNGTAGDDTLTGTAGAELIFGLDGADTISGAGGADIIAGGTGADILTGGAGADTFRYLGGEIGTGVDAITDFTVGVGGDALDVAALLSGFDASSSVIAEFLTVSEADGNSTIRIDADGAAGGSAFTDLVVLEGVTGLDLEQMRTNGNLIV